MDEPFSSGLKLAYKTECRIILEYGDETEVSYVQRNRSIC